MSNRPGRIGVLMQAATGLNREGWWQPAADVCRTRTGWLLKFELAGVKPEDMAVETAGSRIKVSGVRRDWVVEEAESYHSMEISYNRFERALELPCCLDGARLEMECRDGILLVRVTPEGEKP